MGNLTPVEAPRSFDVRKRVGVCWQVVGLQHVGGPQGRVLGVQLDALF